jgi:catechol 2,3-dioxygenase-like lactoylglutathione lyase family enzyme
MLNTCKIVAFVLTEDAVKARDFYEGLLGLRFVSDDPFALVLDANGIMLRVVKMKSFTPLPSTVLGWEIPDIEKEVSELAAKGIKFQSYGLPGQDERGIWGAPGGGRVAWCKDPDGNVLSVSQHT